MKINLEISTLKLGSPKCCEITFLKMTDDEKREHVKLKNNCLSLPWHVARIKCRRSMGSKAYDSTEIPL